MGFYDSRERPRYVCFLVSVYVHLVYIYHQRLVSSDTVEFHAKVLS